VNDFLDRYNFIEIRDSPASSPEFNYTFPAVVVKKSLIEKRRNSPSDSPRITKQSKMKLVSFFFV
jgi:hypothetical protein